MTEDLTRSGRRILVVCPGGVVSGGPEVLHQLVDSLRRRGRDAYICYFPFDRSHRTPSEYGHYQVAQHAFVDDAVTTVVLPESATKIAARLHQAEVLIWWLSVDNFFMARGRGVWSDRLRRWGSLYTFRLPLHALRRHAHLAQSVYAAHFLERHGIASRPLGDYISDAHHQPLTLQTAAVRRDVVLFNPRKGFSFTGRLMRRWPHFQFEAIEGLGAREVAQRLRSAKLYIDFGHHPGKDRLPREAALSGCCVITGLRGAAAFEEDVGIPRTYKLDETNPLAVETFGALVQDIFAHFERHSDRFAAYRACLAEERSIFDKQVAALFG